MQPLLASDVYARPSFDTSHISSIVAHRNSRFHLDLSNHSLTGVLSAYQTYERKRSPKYSNTAVQLKINELSAIIGEEIMPIDVCDEFWCEFISWLLSKDLKPSTAKNYCDNIRAALNWGSAHRCPVSETYKMYKVNKYAKTKVVLTPSQISHIYYYEIDQHHKKLRKMAEEMDVRRFSFKVLKKVQDQFVLACNIGQRYSDAVRLAPECFDETRTIFSITQQKTGNKAVVNLSKYAIDKAITFDILRRYDYTAPCAKMSINRFNECFHLLLRCIGGEFNRVITTENKIGDNIVSESRPMWQALSSHSARRSFATYWGKNQNIPMTLLQRMTGHSDLRSLQAYVIFTDKD